MKLHFELEQSEVQSLLMLVNAGGMLANQSQLLMQRLTEQIQAQQPQQMTGAARPNGENRPEPPGGNV